MRTVAALALLLLNLLLSSPVSAADLVGNPLAAPSEVRFGAVEAYTAPDRAREAGVAWERIIYNWASIQPTSASDWNDSYFPDSLLERELRDGRRVVGLLIGTPGWAGGDHPNDVPANLYLPFDARDNHWGQFVAKIVSRYRGRIDDWIIWNEPDVWNDDNQARQWNGSVEQYYQLVKVASQAARASNPNSRIILAGLTYWWDKQYDREQFFQRFLETADRDPSARANGYYFDVATLQLYNNPRSLFELPIYFRQLMRDHDLEKPIWINETNAVPWDDDAARLSRGFFRVTLDEQASYLIQAFASALAGGVERIAAYKMRDDPGQQNGLQAYGLVRSDPNESTRPVYRAYQVITQYMSGVRSARMHREGNVAMVEMERERNRVSVVWNLSPTATNLPLGAHAPSALLVDKLGDARQIAAIDGKYPLNLPPATANTIPGAPNQYFVGGSPLLLIEDREMDEPILAGREGESAPGTDQERDWISPATGYRVSGAWLDYFQAHGSAEQLGHPIGRAGPDPADPDQTVQYFQRAVLEWHPENPPEHRIQRRLLGDLLHPGVDPPVDPEDATSRPQGESHYFSNQLGEGLGHYVSDYAPDGSPTRFRAYFDSHGGVDSFGYPKEEPKLRGGRWTQRFQAAVMEVASQGQEGDGSGLRVSLEDLGKKALSEMELPLGW